MIGYVTLGSNDMAKARAFYDALLGSMGAKRIMDFGEGDGGFTLWGTTFDQPGVAVTKPYDQKPATVGNGCMTALAATTREQVDSLHAQALELGGTCEGPPGLRGEEGPQAFYAAYFRDLDGNKLAAFKMGGE